MRVLITCDANQESGVGEVVGETSGPTVQHFALKNYGTDLKGICMVLMCRNPDLNFKRRVRLAKKTKTLYLDVMLDLDEMRAVIHEERRRIIVGRLAREVPETVAKYCLKDFDLRRFTDEFRAWLDYIERGTLSERDCERQKP